MKYTFVLLPVIQKIYSDKTNANNRELKFAPFQYLQNKPSALVAKKRQNGLHCHRRFLALSGPQDDVMVVDKNISRNVIVKIILEDAAGCGPTVSRKENST
jgi:hypothetical protein